MGKNTIALILPTILLIFSFLYLFFVILQNRELYLEKFDPKLYEKKYNQSQWVVPNSKNVISDEDLFTYVGYRYVKGLNPILINPETAHLGKYLIGLSILLFNNQRVMSLAVAFLSLFVISHIVYFSTKSYFALSIAVFLTVVNTSFTDQLIHAPQLDIYQLLFFLLFIIFFLIYKKVGFKLFLFSAGLSLGYFISTKFFLVGFIIMNIMLLAYYFFSKTGIKKIFIELAVLNLISLSTYVFTYIGYFILGGTFRGFLGVQKYIFVFYESSKIEISKLLGSYLHLIFFNNWRYWTDGYPIIHYQYWSILWPVVFILGLLSAFKLLLDKKARKDDLTVLLTSFLIVYNLFLFITPIYPRYLLLLFVPLNILVAVYFGRILERVIPNLFRNLFRHSGLSRIRS
ncbi:hypothetical protein A3A46_03265 [Candidatus Roizmanbacteria bacterium RIFCSPLOWO2_01_FULL_37_13]|uniref:Glycosyltransferase RgtA/B/C/D-like domain-containing protein n=1 Tax=Candidatus Roizmanbacteria bacterium RIFCSPHIGHO2_02_FULL_38_11 TaxID=1802039 RepID=A0A1F7GWH1_9BACT|nr:MAG: hypothetical protein A3C25_02100 [Candidatus Roizmanbacteria bacterium RIFCSPHIGHO2_02_FULL_38_11]OGK33264.1 MAG: hypothetical protein A3F58_03625 [Candidatus Roizmanbacteria bacterium RIFCSPHIGHO2_12_FULL_37_9b]OGK43151.1 MAG: hypothetical protein A3A46_03265 [Candidatus Roizmanbacteria bacterium RIFCSPLOWO2_01_FULL_37_13]